MMKRNNNIIPDDAKRKLEDQPGFLTRVALQRVKGIFTEVFHDANLTATQHVALMAIDNLGPTNQRRLSQYKSVEPSNLHGVLKKLKKRKLIKIDLDPNHKRRSSIDLTAAGRRLLTQLESADREVARQYLSPLNENEKKQFMKLMYKVAFNKHDKELEE